MPGVQGGRDAEHHGTQRLSGRGRGNGRQGPCSIYRVNGCEECGHSGFKGRTGIYELVVADDGLRELIHDRASEQSLTAHVRRNSPSIAADGRAKVLAGVTSVNEVTRVSLAV